MQSEQEEFWKGDFGTAYTARCRVDWEKRIPFWRQILGLTQANSVLELGANVGWNLRAIKTIDREIFVQGVEINSAAINEGNNEMRAMFGGGFGDFYIFPAKATDLGKAKYDLVFSAGLLIHVPPSQLHETMASAINASNRWVLAVEYAADEETEVEYRGHTERLWKRPFGKLYAEMGLTLRHTMEAGGGLGFDDCVAWLLERK